MRSGSLRHRLGTTISTPAGYWAWQQGPSSTPVPPYRCAPRPWPRDRAWCRTPGLHPSGSTCCPRCRKKCRPGRPGQGPGVGGRFRSGIRRRGRSRLAEVIGTCVAGALPLVLDASALDLVTREDLDRLRAAGAPVVLTPHPGELLRLAGRLAPEMNVSFPTVAGQDPVTAARAVARELGAVVLLKGPTTVCVAPDGRTVVQNEGGPELATAGSGDTLAGLVGSALTRAKHGEPVPTVEKAAAAAWLHGEAGARAAVTGPFGASALAAAVRSVLVSAGHPARLD